MDEERREFEERVDGRVKELAIGIATMGKESPLPEWYLHYEIAMVLNTTPWDLFKSWQTVNDEEIKERGVVILHAQRMAEQLIQQRQREMLMQQAAEKAARDGVPQPGAGLVVPRIGAVPQPPKKG